MMAYEMFKSTQENFGKFICQLQPKTPKKRILVKL